MPSGTRVCKICGCTYPYCKTVTQNRFRYQDVACSPEHATEYFRKVELSRLKEAVDVVDVECLDENDDDTGETDE